MTAITAFTNTEFGEVRTMMRDGEPWFVAADVCRALELDRTWNALQRLDEDEKGTTSISTLGGEQEVSIINEAGLYTLVLGSRKPEAKVFKRWITHEVIPSIRKNGAYLTPEMAHKVLSDPQNLIQLLTTLQEKNEDVKRLTAEVAEKDECIESLRRENRARALNQLEYAAKAIWADTAIEHGENLGIRDTAHELGIKETDLIKLLLDKKYLYRAHDSNRRLLPYSTPKVRGVFAVKEVKYSGGLKFTSQTLVTPAGRAKLTAECVKAGLIPMMPEPNGVLWEV